MPLQKFKTFFKYILIDILVAALLSFLLITYVISAYKVDGDSMVPVLENNERILISKLSINKENIQRFDITVFYKPDEPEKTLVKRVIGLPEEIIEIREGSVLINNQLLRQPFFQELNRSRVEISSMKPLLIPKGHYFLMGDNRSNSRDSREFGPVPLKYIFGKAIFRYWPFAKIGKISR